MLRQLSPPRLFVYVALGVALSAKVGWDLAQSHKNAALRLAVDAQAAQLREVNRQLDTANKIEDERLNILESFVFGVQPPPARPAAAPEWLLNAAKQNRDRIAALERWRQSVEEKIK